MTAGWRLRIAAIAVAFGSLGVPALAQNAVVPANTAQDVVGPPQLQDFSLNGTVTRQAETPPPRQQPAQPAQATQPTTAQTEPPPRPATEPAQRQQAERQAPAETRRRETARAEAPAASAPTGLGSGTLFDLAPPTAAQPVAVTPQLPTAAVPPADSAADESSGFPSLPWLLALVAAAGAAAWYFLRQRPRFAYAGDAPDIAEPAPEPKRRPEPLQRAPAPAPAPAPTPEAPPVPQGIVSTRLRPWLDIAVAPQTCRVGDDGATLEFEVTVANSGSAPARDVLVEALMLNADPTQDKQIGAFFQRPAGQGERIATIPPLKSMTMRSALRMTREQMRQFEAGDRKLFVPLIALNALYRHGGGEAQTSAAFLVGRDGAGDKMAPFVVDAAPRRFNGLAARALEPSVRR
jgi:hypothetical protein